MRKLRARGNALCPVDCVLSIPGKHCPIIVTGCVAITREGARLGKGGGYSDLEYALLREAGKVTDQTLVATTVHPA